MSGIFSSFNTANKGLLANQTGLHTASHNIANANTRGYTRQRVEFKADIAYSLGGVGQLGTGVKMDSIRRVVDDYITRQIREETGTLERYKAKSAVIDQLEVIFNEPSDTGLNFYLSEMFDSWQELSVNPESLNSKIIVARKSEALAETINHMTNQIINLKNETVDQLEKNALDFNSIVDKLKALNQQILNIAVSGQIPNDLLDQRDLMLQDLSEIANFHASFDEYGRATVTIDEVEILAGDEITELSLVKGIEENEDGTFNLVISRRGDSLKDPVYIRNLTEEQIADYKEGTIIFNPKDKNVELTIDNIRPSTNHIRSGTIQGNQEALEDIEESLDSLGRFARTMAKAINTIHTANNGPGEVDGVTYYNIFTIEEKNGVSYIRLSDEIQADESRIWVGKYPDSPVGDGSRALAIARLRNSKLLITDDDIDLSYDPDTMSLEDKLGGITIEGAYGNIVVTIGISKEHSDNEIANQEVLVGQLDFKREASSGVSINEEMTNVIKFQKAYEANARVIQALTEMLDVLIHRTGV